MSNNQCPWTLQTDFISGTAMNHSKVSREIFHEPYHSRLQFPPGDLFKHAKKQQVENLPKRASDWESRLRNKPKRHANGQRWHGEEERGQKKERVKTLSNSTVTLKPRLLSFFDSSTSNSSPGRRLLTPGALPFKLSWVYSCEAQEQGIKLNYSKQGHAV